MPAAWDDTFFMTLARRIERCLCRVGFHLPYYKYRNGPRSWDHEHAGYHCYFCETFLGMQPPKHSLLGYWRRHQQRDDIGSST